MAAGDASRIWFEELQEDVRAKWADDLSIERLISITDHLNSILQRVRSDKKILPPQFWCSTCQKIVRSAEVQATVRATILAAQRFGVAGEDQTRALDKEWRVYRRKNSLDGYGKDKKPKLIEGRDGCYDQTVENSMY